MDVWTRFSIEVSHRPAIYYLAYGSNLSLERMAKRCEYYKLLDDGYARWGFDVEILDKGLSDSIGVKPAKAYLARFQKL